MVWSTQTYFMAKTNHRNVENGAFSWLKKDIYSFDV